MNKNNNIRMMSLSCGVILASSVMLGFTPQVKSKGTVQLPESFYKIEEMESTKLYEWEEILIERARYDVPKTVQKNGHKIEYEGFKSFEPSYQITYGEAGALNRESITNENGFQMINDRYLVAIGTKYNLTIGQYFDIVLENGIIIPCVMGDTKADVDTDDSNMITMQTKCATEFIVTIDKLPNEAQVSGNVSSLCEEWDSPVKTIITYENVHKVTK